MMMPSEGRKRLAEAASALYFAGVWVREDSTDPEADKKLWEDLRDALGLKPEKRVA
jgi:hypothetical protein